MNTVLEILNKILTQNSIAHQKNITSQIDQKRKTERPSLRSEKPLEKIHHQNTDKHFCSMIKVESKILLQSQYYAYWEVLKLVQDESVLLPPPSSFLDLSIRNVLGYKE